MFKGGRLLCLSLAVGFTLFTGITYAQEQSTAPTSGTRGMRGGPAGYGGGIFRAALALPDLTAEQKTKIEKLQSDFQEKLKAEQSKAGESTTGGRPSFSPEMRKLFTDSREEVMKVLTDDQKKELEAKMPQRGARRDRQTSASETK